MSPPSLHVVPGRPFVLFYEIEDNSHKEWLVKGMLGAGEASTVYGPPGSGKSVLVEDLALHVAAGWDWHGRPVKRGAVVYVALERKALVKRRAIAFRLKHGVEELPFAVTGNSHDLRDPRAVAMIVAICRQVEDETGVPVVLVVLDTLSRAMAGGDENSPKDMGALVAATSKLQDATGAHVLWVHHVPHDGDRMRGHGALLGAMDTTVAVAKGEVRTATVIKANDSEEGESVSFTLESVTVGEDTTAPVVVPADGAAINRSSAFKWSRGLRVVHEAIVAATIDHGFDHRVGGDGPVVKAVKVAVARQEHNARYLHGGEGDRAEAERKAWQRNLKDARDRGLIGSASSNEGDLLWQLGEVS